MKQGHNGFLIQQRPRVVATIYSNGGGDHFNLSRDKLSALTLLSCVCEGLSRALGNQTLDSHPSIDTHELIWEAFFLPVKYMKGLELVSSFFCLLTDCHNYSVNGNYFNKDMGEVVKII